MKYSIHYVSLVVAFSASHLASGSSSLFSNSEKNAIVANWKTNCQYKVSDAPSSSKSGVWQVRLSVEGSKWIHAYYKKRGYSKVNPQTDLSSTSGPNAAWDQWIDSKIAYDRDQAAVQAAAKNGKKRKATVSEPKDQPQTLLTLMGDAPTFAECVRPQGHSLKFSDGTILTYEDNVQLRPKYAYYRFSNGINSEGTSIGKMSPTEVSNLFDQAQVNLSIQRVFKAVSLLEGGFDSVNTYDTGYLSVGFLQFAALDDGCGSLGPVLVREKSDNPKAFDRDFRNWGIDVTDDGLIVAMNLETKEVSTGPDAIQTIIDDKRLTSVFQHAGKVSDQFRVAQMQWAVTRFYPAYDVFKFTLANGEKVDAKVYEIMRSEAGIATLMDRKVNIGNIRDFGPLVQKIINDNQINDLSEIAAYEPNLIAKLKYRKDFLSNNALSQPKSVIKLSNTRSLSRGN